MALSKPMEMMAAATAAGCGGFLSTSFLYPLDTLKTRMQSGASLLPEDEEEDAAAPKKNKQVALIKSLYKGIQYKALESSTSKFMYFYAYTMLAQMVAPKDGKPIGTIIDLGIGYLSELCHLPITMPMELVGTRMQTGSESGSILQILRSIVKESGIGGLYKGLGAYFVLCLQPAIQYTVFERLKGVYLRKFKQASQALGALEAFVLGAIARSFATLVLFPYIRAKKETIASTLQRVYTEEGPLALYRGLGPELTRGALSSALMLMIKEKIQMYITLLRFIVNSA
ncbi:Mitochondrial Carrier (MC) Family [Phytophthora infestans T30-4]|uniref:Mitochondrial Carrier (MC) Family n=1 Tax=Phytophthora infestans (strain T30-4) TaxID=403677 RepID=D0NEE8_PHYIT|nr:Mitochondrial Carrier (MC) Family [Phytophthora infestans T30-4]EEY56593.1 Mitochondrial Carrier (MC) Family [Phytophthora infestans T30-4]|eukprot:XP_002902667.1 Mitochondrial Carrier (MC) Family [Phytophthora infestans T30-4]